MLRTLSLARTGWHIPCVSPAHPQILRCFVTCSSFQTKPPSQALRSQISYPTEKILNRSEAGTISLHSDPTCYLHRMKTQEIPSATPRNAPAWKSPNKAELTKLINPLWTFQQAWFSSSIMKTWYKGQYLFWAYVNDCLDKIHFQKNSTMTIHQNGSLETHVTKATFNINMCM